MFEKSNRKSNKQNSDFGVFVYGNTSKKQAEKRKRTTKREERMPSFFLKKHLGLGGGSSSSSSTTTMPTRRKLLKTNQARDSLKILNSRNVDGTKAPTKKNKMMRGTTTIGKMKKQEAISYK